MKNHRLPIWYLNGKFLKAGETRVPISDLGLQRGWGVFDYCRTYNGKPSKLEDHLNRFYHSANATAIKIWISKKELKLIITKLLKVNGASGNNEVGVKMILTAGESFDGVTPSGKPTLCIMVIPLIKYPQKLYQIGASLTVCRENRSFPEVKTTNYLAAMIALKEAKKNGFDDILYIDANDEVLESSRSNFFAFFGDRMVTAKDGVLGGVTRKIVIELAKKHFIVEQRKLFFKELDNASEAFITSTEREIMPVVQVGKIRIGNGKVGLRTKQLMGIFKEATSVVAIIK